MIQLLTFLSLLFGNSTNFVYLEAKVADSSKSEESSESSDFSEKTMALDGASNDEEASNINEVSDQGEAALALKRAKQLFAFLNGTLDLRIDTRDLFVVDLEDLVIAGEEKREWLSVLSDIPEKPLDKVPKIPNVEDLEPSEALHAALRVVLSLTEEKRQELIENHAKRQLAAEKANKADELRKEKLASTLLQASQIEAFLNGTLDLNVNPESLFQIDLADRDEVALSPSRRMNWLGQSTKGGDSDANKADSTTGPENTDEFAKAQAQLDEQRKKFLRLPAQQRTELFVLHQERVEKAASASAEIKKTKEEIRTAKVISEAESEAAAAAKARESALEMARVAKSEGKRMFAEERARLLGIKEAQANYEAAINGRKAVRSANHDKALEWSRRINELAKGSKFPNEKAAEADSMYKSIRRDLSEMREQLREELKNIREAGVNVPSVNDGIERDLPSGFDREELTELRTELLNNKKELTELEEKVSWELAQGLRDDVVRLNRSRISLLEIASPHLRSSVTGFGSAGVDQIRRELDQISVELRFHALKIAQFKRYIATDLQGSSIALMIGSVQFLLALAVYLWWRKRGGPILLQAERFLRSQHPQSRLHMIGATIVWYLHRVRRPLELLLVLRVLLGLMGNTSDLPEVVLLWIVASWVLWGLAIILFVDGLAAQETLYSTSTRDTSALRIHSLRVVGINIITVGLILSLASAIVGKGAIYSWVISTCWLISFPVALYLVYKWKPIIFERIELLADQSPFTNWVESKKEGVASFPVAAIAAVYLLAVGILTWAMRQMSGLEVTRRLLAYLFRREVAKQAAATEADSRYTPIQKEIYEQFGPEVPPERLNEEIAKQQIEAVVGLAASSRPTISAVVGERGAGKTKFLERVAARVKNCRVLRVQCPEEGSEALLAELARRTDSAHLRHDELPGAFQRLGPAVVVIDNLQCLVVPAVKGLQQLDDFIEFTRKVGGKVSWVVSIGAASWHYVRRARRDKIFFEQIVMIPRWSEEELGQLIRSRCAAVGIQPSFEGLVVPRQNEAPLRSEGNRSEAGYYRLLWDFSDGNPAVAMHAFRESLFLTPENKVVVRLFKAPSPEEIEDLPSSILFVLRTIVQLELAQTHEVESATQLPKSDVEDAIRFALARGYLESFGTGVRLSWPWYRTITIVLRRQHLLSSV